MLVVFLSTVWLFIIGYNKLLFLRAIINSIFIFLLLFAFSIFYLNINNKSSVIENGNSGNAGVVLGAAVWRNKPSPSLSSRADKAAKLLNEGKISKIHLTGSNAPGELSESEMAYNYLKSKNVDMTKVEMESRTTSTNEQIRYIKMNLYNKAGIGDVIIISDNYHLSRIKEICNFQNMDIKVVSSDLIHSFRDKLYYNFREAIGIIIFWLFAL
jgi:vancomycin permeability regulator SanA